MDSCTGTWCVDLNNCAAHRRMSSEALWDNGYMPGYRVEEGEKNVSKDAWGGLCSFWTG